jgi:hypothetical protein
MKGQAIRYFKLKLKAGENSLTRDGNDNEGRGAPACADIFKLSTASSSQTIKAIQLQ